MKSKSFWLLSLGVVALAVAAWWWFESGNEDAPPPPPASTRIGTIRGDLSAPIFLAQEKGYFSDENLKAEIALFESGAEATTALLEGRVDFATAAEYVFVLQAFKNPDLRILGVVTTGQITEVVARTDRGMNQPEDLRGKRVGVPRGTHAEYFLARFLAVHGLLRKELDIVDMKPSDQAEALRSGQVDAVVAWDPYLLDIKRRVMKETVSWQLRDHDFYWLLLGRQETVRDYDFDDRIIRALAKANSFLDSDPVEGRRLVSGFIGEEERSAQSWESFYFHFELPQPLLSVMEEEARWAIENHLVDSDRVPNYLEYIDLGSISRVDAHAVTLIQ